MWSALVIVAASIVCASARNVDLSHGIDESSLYWVNVQPFTFTKRVAMNLPDGSWYAANEFCAGEHGGTHFDAPYHFHRDGWKVGDVPLDNLIAPALVIDLQAEVQEDRDFQVEEHHLQALVRDTTLPDKLILLINYGWAQYYSNRTAYFGHPGNDTTQLHFPGLSGAAARLIVSSGRVLGVGVDTPSLDRGQFNGLPVVHQTLTAASIYMIEGLKLDAAPLPARGITLFVMPMKIMEGTGAPCRVVAVIPDE